MKKLQKRNSIMNDTVETFACSCGCRCGCTPSWSSDGASDTRYNNKLDIMG